MKVSKVEHMRTAVGKKACKESVTGMIYKSPVSQNDLELRSHLSKQNNENQKKYSLFGGSLFYLEREFENNLKGEEFNFQKKLAKYICQKFSDLENKLLKDDCFHESGFSIKQLDDCKDKKEWEKKAEDIVKTRVKQQLNILQDYDPKGRVYFQNKKGTQSVDKGDFIHKLVTFQLRKSLRKTVTEKGHTLYLPDVVEKLVLALCSGSNDYKTKLKNIENYELSAFLKAVNCDYLRLKQIKDIVKSIEKKNVKVQVGKENLLQLSNATHPKKKVIFEFLKRYSDSDRKEQDMMLCHMQMLIVLYLEGPKASDRLNHAQGKCIWQKNRYQWSENDVFDSFKKNEKNKDDIMDLLKQKFNHNISAVEKKRLRKKIQETVNKMISEHFRAARDELQKMKSETQDEDMFWLLFIEKTVEKALDEQHLKSFKLQLSRLYQFIWRDWISYMALKYIDMGKAVYHFAMPDLLNKKKEMHIREAILPENKNEITSFDYELIKANETLERDLSLYISFAINRLSRAVAPESSYEKIEHEKSKDGKNKTIYYTDLLFVNSEFSVEEETGKFVVYKDYLRRLLQYFGGQSQYNNIEEKKDYELIKIMKNLVEYVRNYSFHYTGTIEFSEANNYENELLGNIYQQELSQVNSFYRKKYYSNNVPAFYEDKDIKKLMEHLYQSPKNTPAQIPAFNRVLPRKKLKNFLEAIGIKKTGLQYQSCIYFILKELYYYDFIKQDNLAEMFILALKNRKVQGKEFWAKKNFVKRINSVMGIDINSADNITIVNAIKKVNLSMGELAQIIMTDYTMQNQEKKVRTNTDKHTEEIYKHFPILLAEVLRDAFQVFLQAEEQKNIYGFLTNPTELEKPDEQSFCDVKWNCKAFDGVLDKKNKLCYSWYVTAHFVNPRYLNLLIGSIKNYIAYVNNIIKRARDAENEIAVITQNSLNKKISVLQESLTVLEFVMVLSGRVSHCFSDYFQTSSEEDAREQYARYLARFVDFTQSSGSVEELKEFCNRQSKNSPNPNNCIGIYYDEKNPILNRNIILSRLYGDEKLMTATMPKIDETEIQLYYELMNDLSDVFMLKEDEYPNESDQKKLVKFQHLKNRIELHDVMKMSEITNDLISQMISWSYLRERDLMYFQLGYHYIKLFYGGTKKEEEWKHKIYTDDFAITEGALLYQIVAIYTFSLPLYLKGKDKKWKAGDTTASGSALQQFRDYCNGSYNVYTDGLHLFEEVDKQHDEMILFRNYSDHFKYYAFHDMSILDMYSQVYAEFFSYDRKLQKSVSCIFPNILQRYSVKAEIKIEKPDSLTRLTATLTSDDFTYTVKENEQEKKIKIPVREEKFLQQLQSILEYKIISE